MPPRTSSNRITSAPSCASVIPPSGAETNADPWTSLRPSSTPVIWPRTLCDRRRSRQGMDRSLTGGSVRAGADKLAGPGGEVLRPVDADRHAVDQDVANALRLVGGQA